MTRSAPRPQETESGCRALAFSLATFAQPGRPTAPGRALRDNQSLILTHDNIMSRCGTAASTAATRGAICASFSRRVFVRRALARSVPGLALSSRSFRLLRQSTVIRHNRIHEDSGESVARARERCPSLFDVSRVGVKFGRARVQSMSRRACSRRGLALARVVARYHLISS